MKDCVFCKIVKKQIPSKFLFESDKVIVIKDINPAAKVHLLVIPKKHIKNFEKITKNDDKLLLEMLEVARKFIKKMKIQKKYRVSFNGGSLIIVNHLHMHLLGGDMKRTI